MSPTTRKSFPEFLKNSVRHKNRRSKETSRKLRCETFEKRMLFAADIGMTDAGDVAAEVQLAEVENVDKGQAGIVNGDFKNGLAGWRGVDASSVNKDTGAAKLDSLPSASVRVQNLRSRSSVGGRAQLDTNRAIVEGVYQEFTVDEPTNLAFSLFAAFRQDASSDVELYVDGEFVDTISSFSGSAQELMHFHKLEAGEHSILFKEVNGQSNARGPFLGKVSLVSDAEMAMMDSKGVITHNFYEHVSSMFGTELMAPGQTEYDSKLVEKVNDKLYKGNSPITGLRPIIEQAIDTERKRNPLLRGEALESKVANRLTNLNDFTQLTSTTQDHLIEMTGIDFRSMSQSEQEHTINHLQHSPIPFGAIEEVLTPDTKIDLGYTHTLDKNWTRVAHEGDGVWKVWIISNNNNGSHTGHNLGEFRVQLAEDTSPRAAKQAANEMIVFTNNNNRLSLDEAAKDILYGITLRIGQDDSGIINGDFENGHQGWRGVNAESVNKDTGVDDLDALPDSWVQIDHNRFQRESGSRALLDTSDTVVEGLYQKFTVDEPTNLAFSLYANFQQETSSDVEFYVDGKYVDTISAFGGSFQELMHYHKLEAGEHSILFKEVNAQSDASGAYLGKVSLVSDAEMAMMDSRGVITHNFYEHVSSMFGTELMAPGQTEYDSKTFEKINDKLYRGNSPITGLRPIIEEAIDTETSRFPFLSGVRLENRIANRLTNLNDFTQLQRATQDKLIEMTGIDFRSMSQSEQEHTINHLQHSPIPFGAIEEVLTPDTRIDLGYTHTLDKSWTRVAHEGDGVWKVWIISNNNNGSHTGHNLGEFRVQLAEDISPLDAKMAAAQMIRNTNDNNRLSLDEAAKDILYGRTPRLSETYNRADAITTANSEAFAQYDSLFGDGIETFLF